MTPKLLIDFEGIDGVGKHTQSLLLYEKLKSLGYKTEYLSFPRYESYFGKLIGHYLNGEYGALFEVPVELSSLLYALDRWNCFNDPQKEYKKFDDAIIVIDRYVASNVAHHLAKIPLDQREDFLEWLIKLEYDMFQIPKPDIILFLDGNPKITTQNVLKKEARVYTQKKKDLHEANLQYMQEVRNIFLNICKSNPSFHLIQCSNNQEMKSIPDIEDDIWKIIHNYI